uniref:CCHC-type domain-containing protein n=1 Tax=Tanacetum cinerariifolium TaxID=118510 RepID=A0A6L2K565_TANCI|nr:hypothetical protein [Tanacetum cinerariifolium]
MTTLAEYMIHSGANNHPPMLDKDLYDSWKSRIELYMQSREHRRMILESVEHDPLIWPTIEENGERECKLYDAFDKFAHIKWKSFHQYYLRFTQQINDMNIYNIKLEQFQVNTMFLTSLPPEWSQQRIVKCFNCQREGNMARHCLKPKRKRDATWFREKVLLVEAQGSGKVLTKEELEFLADPSIAEGPVPQSVITNNTTYQAEDLDAYDSYCDEISTVKAILIANL